MPRRNFIENDRDDEEATSTVKIVEISDKSPVISRRRLNTAYKLKSQQKTSVVSPMFKSFVERRPAAFIENIIKAHEAKYSSGTIEWTESELINQILSAIDLNKHCPFLIRKNDGTYGIDSSSHVCRIGSSVQPITVYVIPFIEPHRQLSALIEFSNRMGTNSKIVEVLQELIIKFLSEHASTISKKYTDKSLSLHMLTHSLRNELEALTIVYNGVSNVISEDLWNYETVDKFIERFLRLTAFAEIRSVFVKRIVRRLQVAFISVLKRYFDWIFSKGEVEETFANEFIFYNLDGSKHLNVLGVRSTACSFWTAELIKNVIEGSRDAKQLRHNSNAKVLSKFSTYFTDALYPNHGGMEFVKASAIIMSAEYAAARCADDNAKQLFSFVQQNGAIDTVMREIELIFTGFAVREFAFDLFGATRDTQLSNIVISFYNSLQMSGFSEERANKWYVTYGNGTIEQLCITPRLPWPINLIVDNHFIETANRCIRFLLKLMRSKEILSQIRINYDKVDGNAAFNQRKLHHLICLTTQPLTVMAEILFTHLQSLFARKMCSVLKSSTINEAREVLMSLNSQLEHIVSTAGSGRALIHGTISKLCNLADELNTRITNEMLTDQDLEDMLKIVLRERELLIGLGNAMQGTIFNVLQLFL